LFAVSALSVVAESDPHFESLQNPDLIVSSGLYFNPIEVRHEEMSQNVPTLLLTESLVFCWELLIFISFFQT